MSPDSTFRAHDHGLGIGGYRCDGCRARRALRRRNHDAHNQCRDDSETPPTTATATTVRPPATGTVTVLSCQPHTDPGPAGRPPPSPARSADTAAPARKRKSDALASPCSARVWLTKRPSESHTYIHAARVALSVGGHPRERALGQHRAEPALRLGGEALDDGCEIGSVESDQPHREITPQLHLGTGASARQPTVSPDSTVRTIIGRASAGRDAPDAPCALGCVHAPTGRPRSPRAHHAAHDGADDHGRDPTPVGRRGTVPLRRTRCPGSAGVSGMPRAFRRTRRAPDAHRRQGSARTGCLLLNPAPRASAHRHQVVHEPSVGTPHVQQPVAGCVAGRVIRVTHTIDPAGSSSSRRASASGRSTDRRRSLNRRPRSASRRRGVPSAVRTGLARALVSTERVAREHLVHEHRLSVGRLSDG